MGARHSWDAAHAGFHDRWGPCPTHTTRSAAIFASEAVSPDAINRSVSASGPIRAMSIVVPKSPSGFVTAAGQSIGINSQRRSSKRSFGENTTSFARIRSGATISSGALSLLCIRRARRPPTRLGDRYPNRRQIEWTVSHPGLRCRAGGHHFAEKRTLMFVRLGWQARARKRIYYRLHAHRYPEGLRTKVPTSSRRT
jgi:hypothetical protein